MAIFRQGKLELDWDVERLWWERKKVAYFWFHDIICLLSGLLVPLFPARND